MAFDFPSSPTNGQTYTLGGVTYTYNGYGWAASGGGSYTKAESDANYVNVIGDTMTGDLVIAKSSNAMLAVASINDTQATVSLVNNSLPRWGMTAQSGGGDLFFTRCNDAGVSLDTPFSISRVTGGATLTGDLTIQKASPQLFLNYTSSVAAIIGRDATAGFNRWLMQMPDGSGNADFALYRYDNVGGLVNPPVLNINRTTGNTTFGGNAAFGGDIFMPGGGQASTQGSSGGYLNPNQANVQWSLESNNGVEIGMLAWGSGGIGFLGTWSNHPLYIRTNNVSRITIATDGAVNIGTLSPLTNTTIYGHVWMMGWSGDATKALLYFGNTGARYLSYDGTNYGFNGAPIYAGNGRLWGASDFSAPLPLAGGTVTGKIITQGSAGGMATSGANQSLTEIQAYGGAYITLHHVGSHAAYFGLDSDNQLKYGGWSVGDIAHKIWHDGICPNNSYYVKMPSGLMFTWMVGAGGDGWRYFPVAFPTVCLGAVATMGGGALAGGESVSCYVHLVQTNAAYIQVRFANNGGGVGAASQGTYIFAWGY